MTDLWGLSFSYAISPWPFSESTIYVDPPSGMDQPTVEETTNDSVTLAWSPPRKGPVTGYVVEKRPKGDKNWTK